MKDEPQEDDQIQMDHNEWVQSYMSPVEPKVFVVLAALGIATSFRFGGWLLGMVVAGLFGAAYPYVKRYFVNKARQRANEEDLIKRQFVKKVNRGDR